MIDIYKELATKSVDILPPHEVRYEGASDASMRLSHTMIRFLGTPIYVMEAETNGVGGLLSCYPYDSDVMTHIAYNDSRLDIRSPPLGWVNTSFGPIYAMRRPLRKQKQGVNPYDLFFFSGSSKARGLDFANSTGDGFTRKTLGKTINGEFPSIGECVNNNGGAFNRDLAIVPSENPKIKDVFCLYDKTVCIGYFIKGVFNILPGYLTKTRRQSLRIQIDQEGSNYEINELLP